MKLNIHGSKIELTASLKDYIAKKIDRLNRYFEDSDNLEARVNLRIRGIQQVVEVTVPTHRFTIRAEVADEDMYAAIDLVVDKLERQIRKNKTRLNNKYRNLEVQEFVFDYETPEEENNEKIVKRKTLESKPMDEEEAILQMELLGHDFFAFKNAKEECVSILYKRKDGHYGILNIK